MSRVPGKRVVMFSGGVGSWGAARRVADQHGTDGLVLLFADTKMEDEDLYRFLHEAAADVGGELVALAEGRTPWEVFRDERFIGNHRVDPCSKILKRQFLDRWLKENCDPENSTIYLGMDWTEMHRWDRAKPRWLPWTVEAPLCERPYLGRWELHEELRRRGIRIPRLYEMGFPHNNCGGFCIKAGHAQFARLLTVMPERYAFHEEQEEILRADLGKNATILTDRTGSGPRRPLSLRDFRERIQAGHEVDMFDWGGCGCFEEPGPEVEASNA